MPALHTFGDSILDCGHYNAHGAHPGALLVRNDDALFPAFRGRDLARHGYALAHHAVDGATAPGLGRQLRGVTFADGDIILVTIGGNDLLGGLVVDKGAGLARFAQTVDAFLSELPRGRVLLANVYDPTVGDDAANFLPIPPEVGRDALARMNATLAALAVRHGQLVDLHGHFLRGDATWFTRVIEPSLEGASQVRAAFLPHVEALVPLVTR